MRILACAVVASLLTTACSTAEPSTSIEAGRYVAENAVLDIAQDGNRLYLLCHQASLPSPIAVDAQGRFELAIIVEEFGFQYLTYPARLSGQFEPGGVRFRLIPLDNVRPTETYLLRRGNGPLPPPCG